MFFRQLCQQIRRYRFRPDRITLTDSRHDDYTLGFEVQAPVPLFCSWGMPYEEVIALPCVACTGPGGQDGQSGTEYYFQYPVRVGNLLCSRLRFWLYPEQRRDIAVLEYRADSETGYLEHDFQHIRQELGRHLQPDACSQPSQAWFQQAQLHFSLSYFGRRENAAGACVSLTITNARDDADLLTDEAYEAQLHLSQVLLLPGDQVSIPGEYKKNAAIKRRPPQLTEQFGNQAVIWRDDANGRLGVSAGGFSYTVALADIETLTFERMLPAKGHGADIVRLHLKNETYPRDFFHTDNYLLDRYPQGLETVSRHKMLFAGVYYNC